MPIPSSNPLKDIEILVRSHFGVIYVDTAEEERLEGLLRHLADGLTLSYFSWSSTKGLRQLDKNRSILGTESLQQALADVEKVPYPAIFYFSGLEAYLDDKIVLQRLKDVALALTKNKGALFFSGQDVGLPEFVAPLCSRIKLPAPDANDYKDLVKHLIRDLSARMNVKVELTPEEGQKLLQNLRGLTLMEARKVLTRVTIEDGILGPESIQAVQEAKKTAVEKDGLLEYYPTEESMTGVAGLKGLKSWLAKRKEIIANPSKAKEFGLTFPKGILLLGVQGCGKSLCAKAAAMEWGLPLLRFDPSTLYNKYIGETEKNFKRAVAAAEKTSPVILWIDEIEKAFSSSGGEQDGGLSTRILGSFLTWLQDRRGDVFVMATANNIEQLPPELLRKGRFDEIFFVDLPDAAARAEITNIHLRKKGRDPQQFDVEALVRASDGYSGAEIEQAIVSGLYSAFSVNGQLTTELLLQELALTKPLSQTMSEKVSYIRSWAKDRTVPAN